MLKIYFSIKIIWKSRINGVYLHHNNLIGIRLLFSCGLVASCNQPFFMLNIWQFVINMLPLQLYFVY